MEPAGARELNRQAGELIRRVREERKRCQIACRGDGVALLIPVEPQSPAEEGPAWTELDHPAAETGARWLEGASAAQAVAEGRQ